MNSKGIDAGISADILKDQAVTTPLKVIGLEVYISTQV
jgi:hypothetical protein